MKKFFQNKIKLLISLTFLILFVFNTVAYSGLATKLAITSEAMFRPITDIRVTDIKLDSATNGAVESYSPKFNVDTTTTGFVLPNVNSTITYKVKVTNYGNVNQTIYNFIKNSINSSNVNIKITDFTSVCADDSCSQKNSDFTIIHHNGDNTTDSNEKEILITFSTSAPSDQAINVIEKYDFRPIYNINYDANGGQNAPKSQIKIYKDNLTLTTDEPTRPSYKFLGWSTSSKSTTAEYKAGDSYNPGTNEEVKDIILYAVWQKKQAKLDLNYNIDGTWYYSGYNNKIQTGIKVNGEDKGYLNDFDGTYDYGTIYEIYGFKIDGVTIPYSKKYTVDGTNHLGISFNTINFKVNDTNLGSVTPTQLIVIPETTFTISSNVITLSDGRIATASTKDVTGYKTKFSSYTITPNSTTINAKTTAQANFTKEAEKYTITLDNKNATTAGTTTIYEKYNTGIYLDSALTKVMTTTTNPIAKPAKTGYTFKGYYTKENGQGDQIINENGYITEKATNTTYKANTTLYAYYKDETKPTLTLTNSSNGNWTNKDVTITLNGADSGSGIKEYQLKYSGSSNAWKKTTAPKDTWGAERNETVYYRTVDNAGNESDAVSTSIRIDKTAPKIELNGTTSSSEINNSNNVTIPIKITETASGINNSEFTASDISVLINGTKVNPSTKTLTYNNVSNGIYSYTLTLSGITLNGKVTLEIAAGAVKDIATNSNSKTTLDPSITVSNIYTISLNGNGTPAIYEKYNTGIYLDSALTSAMTTSANPITKPIRSYTVSFNANNTGITMPSAITKSYSYSGHYTDASTGTQMINENGYITSSFKKTSYTANATLYAHWKAKPSVTIPSISKTGYTCSWNTSADGKGTTYNAGDVTDKLNTQTLYVVCKANSYTVSYNSNGGSGTMTNDTATYDSNFITKKNTFTKTGYTFNGWNEKADGTGTVWGLTTSGVYESGKTWKWTYTKNITLYAQWKANTNTKYVVKHYKQKLDGTYPSEADDTDNLTGTADSSVSPAIKSYAGFTSPSLQTVTIAADGSTVVTYKYTRNKYTFTLGSTTGITTTGSTASGSYYYGSTITLKASANTGYIFTGWTSSNTSLVGNQTTANTTFTMPAGNITMTPSVTVNSYTVTYDTTTNGGSTAKQTASTKYKSLVDLTKKAEKSGYEFVGWNTNKDATSVLSSYEMPAKDVTLYAIYKKTLTATFNYYNSKSETRSVTIYNNATIGSITSPAALGTPSGYTFRHYSTSSVANAAKTIDANSAVVLTGNQTYYASYQKNVTLNFYYHSGTDAYANKQTSTTATGVQYLGYNNAIVNSTVSIPSAVAGSTGYCGTSYKGVTAANSTTPISVNTGTTNYYAYYQATITYYYYNGSAHTTGAGTRTAYSNGTNYVTTASAAPTPSSYDGAAFKGWSYTNDSVNDRNPAYTAMTALYAYYQKTVNATFNYYDGSKAASVIAGNTRTYISKSGGVNTINTNITIPDAAKASRGSYTYRGISTSNAANASVVTPTTANTTYYSSYTYAITANFTANGGTGTAPSSAAGTGYMNYSGSKIGISVTMPSNTFTRNGYTFGGWYDAVSNKTYAVGTSVTVDSSRNFNATWNVVTYTIKYNLNGGTVSATNPTSYKATDADITLNNPTKQGYTFTGWTGTGLSEASKAVTIKSGSYGNREYTANYSINQYYYDVNPDSGIKSFDITIDGKTSTGLTDYNQKHNYGTEATITNVVAKPGYTYTGYKVTGSMTTLTGSTNSNIKTKLGAGNGYIALTSNAKTLKFDAQTLASIKYSTTPQALVFEGASNGTGSYSYAITAGNTNGYFNINGTTITTSDKVVPPVGTYKLTVQAIDNTSKVTATADITIVIEKAGSTNPTLTAYSGTYDGQSHTISVSGGSGGTIHYSTDQKTWSTTKPTRTAQGTTTVYVKVVGDSNHTDTGVISSTITIKPATITYTASSYEGFYDGNSHTISVSVTKPTSGATITYSLTENGTYSATKPTVTNATTTPVTVYFKISASNYNTVSSKATITINKTNSVSPKLTAYSGTYDGKPHTIGVTGGSGGTIKYSTDQKTWSTTKPTRTDATTTPVTVYVKVFGDGNHTDTNPISSTITITAQQLPAPKFSYSDISTAGIVTWGNVSNATKYQISIDGTNWTDATSGVDYLSKIIAATGTRTVYVRAVGEGNYSTSKNATASKSVYTVTVNSNSTTMGTVDTSSYNVISGATYSASSNKLLFIGTTTGSTTKTLKTVTATAKSNYTFNNWSSVSGSITSNVTLTANFNSSEFTISLNPNGGTGGTSAIYERYNKGIYLDSGTNSKQMTTSANAITKPTKEPYTISFNANNTGATVPSNYSFSPVFNGYYTATTSNGTQMIDNRGYITNNLTSTKYTSNTTLYAQWNHYYTLPSLSKGGNTCKWAIGSASGTKYNSGTSLFINDNKVFYAVCTPNKYKVKFEPNGGTSSATEMDVTYDSPYGTLPTVTRSASKVNDITINYVFEGWYDSNGTKITETSIVETPSDHTLYAHWLSSPNIKGGTAESWSSTAVTISLNIPSTSDTGTVSYQYYLSETNELPESATWIDITSADGSVSISKNGEFYIFYKATSSAGVSITSNYNKLQIDTQTPSTSITAYQAGTTTTVASNKWINKNLEFKMGALNVGPSSGSIYYCIGDNCTPNTLISPNTAIPADLTNTKTGIYKVRYKAVSNAGLSSSIGEYVAKVDKTAPTMKAVVKSLKDNSTLANLTNSSTTYIDSTWRSYGYSINLNGTTDSQSGISSIERFTNANNLKRADADYKANLHKGVITDTKTFSESGDGAKYAKFVATDNAGNTATFTVEVLIDKTAPTVGVNIYKAKDASTKTGSVICSLPNGCDEAFKWTSYGYYFDFSPSSDELSGIDYYTMRYTAGGKSSVDTSSYEERNVHSAYTTVTSSGARRLEFTATDKAGNTSTYVTKNIYIDMNDPNLVIKLYKADSSGNKTGSVLKTITDNNTAINSWTNYRHYFDLSGSSDSLSGIEKITMQINDSGIVTTGNTASGTSDLKTTYTITSTKHQVVGSSGNRYARFTITDKVGNTSVKNVRIYIDLDSPTLDSASLSPQFQSSTTIKYTCSDKTSGFASFGTKTLSKTYTKNVTSSNSPVKIQCKDTAGNTSSGTRTYTWSANSDKCGTTTEDVYSNGYYCDAGNAASANSSACISYATNTGKTTKYVNKRCMYYCNAKTGTTTVAKTCWHQ